MWSSSVLPWFAHLVGNQTGTEFHSSLTQKLDEPERQMVFYQVSWLKSYSDTWASTNRNTQPGIGTYTDPSLTIKGKLYVAIAKLLDMAFAWYIDGQYIPAPFQLSRLTEIADLIQLIYSAATAF